MRRILFILLFAILAHTATAQQSAGIEHNRSVIESFIDQNRNREQITIVEIGKTMTMLLATKLFEEGDDQSAKLLRSIRSIDIMVDSNKGESAIEAELFSLPDACQQVELISSISQDGELLRFYFAEHAESEDCEFLMLARTRNDRIMLYITGKFSISDISNLSSLSESIIKN